MTFLFILLISSGVSIIGSLQLGAVNSAVIQTALSERRKTGYWVAFGGSLPELIYSAGACMVQDIFSISIKPQKGWIALAGLILIVIGLTTFYKGGGELNTTKHKPAFRLPPFVRGFALGLSNPQLLPFWWLVLAQMSLHFSFESCSHKIAFITGAFLGAFIILSLFNYWADRYKDAILSRISLVWLNRGIGLFLLLLGFIQLSQLFF